MKIYKIYSCPNDWSVKGKCVIPLCFHNTLCNIRMYRARNRVPLLAMQWPRVNIGSFHIKLIHPPSPTKKSVLPSHFFKNLHTFWVYRDSKLDQNLAYGTAQLQGNICTRPASVSARISSCFWQKGCGSYVSLESCRSFIARFCACKDTSRVCSGHVLPASQTRLARIPDTCEHYLGAELYRILITHLWDMTS